MVLGNAIGIREDPLRVAEEIAMLDHLSRGRVVSGFVRGIGWEYFAHSINPTRSRARFEEAHDLIIKAWTSREPFQWISPNYEFRYVNVWPRPLQQPHPPIYIPGAGSTETMRWVAEHRYSYMSVYAPARVTKRWFDGYRDAAAAAGYAPDPEKLVFSVPLHVAETDELAHEQARGPVEWLFHKGLKQGLEIVFPPGYVTPGSLRGMLSSGMSGFAQMTYEDLLREQIVIAGSPDTVREQIARLSEELGFGAMNVLLCIGDMPHDRVVKSMELFAREVMPAFRDSAATTASAAGSP
jgi:alkanesulfonate monooxygenase SsuD/methylene tetrahydromethanopterin reductase-like flavin-dependent oxidoreductase (luciferase family)